MLKTLGLRAITVDPATFQGRRKYF